MNDLEQRPRWARIAKRLLPWAILLAFSSLCLAYMEPVVSLVLAKSAAKEKPQLWNVPQPLHLDPSLPVTGGKLFCSFGYQFKSPWTDITVERKYKTIVALNFSGGQSIGIWNEAQTLAEPTTAESSQDRQSDPLDREIFGYAFRSRVLNATPADLHWISSRQQMARSSTYIEMKSLDAGYMKGGVYSFQTPWFRGFQIGSPSQDEFVNIEFYDPENIRIKLIITSHQGGSKPSQPELNQIIWTLQPVAEASRR